MAHCHKSFIVYIYYIYRVESLNIDRTEDRDLIAILDAIVVPMKTDEIGCANLNFIR